MGVFCYWIVQLLIIKLIISKYRKHNLGAHLLGVLFYGSYIVVFLSHVYNSLGSMRVHGLIYGFTLSLLGSLMIMEFLKRYDKTIALMTTGLFVFSIRDVMLTYNKCYFENDFLHIQCQCYTHLDFFMIVRSFMWLELKTKHDEF